MKYLTLLSVLLVVGCSSTKKIASYSNKVSELSGTSEVHFTTIDTNATQILQLTAGPDPEAFSKIPPLAEKIKQECEQGIKDQQEIKKAAAGINETLPGVKDVEPQWLTALKYVGFIVGIIGITFLVWYSGFGTFLKSIFWAAGSFIPRPVATRAKFDAEAVVNETATPEHREAIAANRGSDPAYEHAFKLEKAKLTSAPKV